MSGGNSKNELNLIILWAWLGPASFYQDNLDNSVSKFMGAVCSSMPVPKCTNQGP